MTRAALLAAALAAGACGSDSAGYYAPDGPRGDAGPDAPPACHVQLSFSPATPIAPSTLAVRAVIFAGPVTFTPLAWTVTGPKGPVATTTTDAAGANITFLAAVAGPYQVSAVLASSCRPGQATINVATPGAGRATYRLRMTPLPGQGVPAQIDQVIEVPGGADFALPGDLALAAGTRVAGQVRGPAGGLAAYLRVDGERPALAELFADATGAYSAYLPSGSYSVLVVPTGASVPPARVTAGLAGLAAGFTLDDGDLVTGSVSGPDGAPLAGARVALGTGSLPLLLGATGPDGRFAVRARTAAGPLSLTVVPAAGALRVELATARGVTIGPDADVAVALPDVAAVTFTPRAVGPTGAALPGAVVTFVDAGDLPDGTITVAGSSHPARAAVRASFVAGAGGDLGAVTLPRGRYHVVVEPGGVPGGLTLGLADVEVGDAAPATLAAAAPVVTLVTVRGPAAPVAGAVVHAIAAGAHGVGAGVTISATTGAAGGAALGLAPGCPYQLLVEPPAGTALARARAALVGGGGPTTLTLPHAIRISGRVVFPTTSGQAGVRVALLCGGCTGADAEAPLAESATGVGGAFELLAPDPGVAR